MSACRLSNKSSGFTILEVLVAFSIMATAVVGLVGLRTQSLYSFQSIQDALAATMVAEDRLERVLMEFNGMDPIDFTMPELEQRYGNQFIVEHELVEPTPEALPPGMVLPVGWVVQQINVLVVWEGDDGRSRRFALSRLVTGKNNRFGTQLQ